MPTPYPTLKNAASTPLNQPHGPLPLPFTMPKILHATLNAFLPEFNVDSFEYHIKNDNIQEAVNCLAFSTTTALDTWINIGTADITATACDREELTNARVTALKQTKTKLQAETQVKINELDHKIQQLLCIEAPKDDDDEAYPF